jgi:heat-inducible transcriptional repressor
VLKFAAESIEEFCGEDFYLHGTRKILDQPEFRSLSKAKEFLDILEDRSNIQKIVSSLDCGQSTRIIIGGENANIPFPDSSIVICQYSTGENTGGTVGIIGPTRMDYSKVVSSLEYLAKVMSRMLSGEAAVNKKDKKKDGGNCIE